MHIEIKEARLWGILILVSIACGILSSVPLLETPGYLFRLAMIERQVLLASFIQVLMALAYAGIALVTYHLVKEEFPKLAALYGGFRFIGVGFLFLGTCFLPLLLWLSQSFIHSGQANEMGYLALAEILRRGRDQINHIAMILPWSLGGLILYFSIFKRNMIPYWFSIWGIAGMVLTLLATVLYMLTIIEMATPLYFLLNAPTALFEIALAFYLIVKSFLKS